ncbi:MAG TPA: hypothetical protein VFT59_02355 [Candidatus Saccharimonadales bacterium]|nr:hypothetical protein [Candidatus Saccharimonadales bacterium]
MKQTLAWLRMLVPVASLLVLFVCFTPAITYAETPPPSVDPALECAPGGDKQGQCDLFQKYVNPIIWFLSAAVGLAVTIGIISGGIRYSASGGDPSQAAAAKKQIRNAIIALIAYLFLLAALNWLIPGGVV